MNINSDGKTFIVVVVVVAVVVVATRVCWRVLWSVWPSGQFGGFPLGIPVNSYTKTTRKFILVPTRIMFIRSTCFVIVVKTTTKRHL